MKCVIVDDDPIQRAIISEYVSEFENLDLIAECEDALEASKLLREQEVDLLFLDVEMPKMTGIDLLKTLRHQPNVIFITSKKQYAVEAFEFEAIDYLTKPVDRARFVKAVNKVIDLEKSQEIRLDPKAKDEIFVKEGNDFVNINVGDINYIQAYGDYIRIFLKERDHMVLTTMKSIMDKLSDPRFTRVHRSYIVNLEKIKRISDNVIEIGKQLIPVSKSYKPTLMGALNML